MKGKEEKLEFRIARLEEFAFDGQSVSSFVPEDDGRVWDPADLNRALAKDNSVAKSKLNSSASEHSI